ncbi:hypothetical protein KVR01_010653 [Diaporthe batatas]|uniref:uncharacterized protein n=1 Tax=Diaporthe batatas TaxID=748121 RepID=UPI001D04A885|nr:uncharacterized protein KVR01_010653 [Diaporthe batatas]KAG8160016.1 hypothetical protein KVR01_010653 [Diaporthe batatas]
MATGATVLPERTTLGGSLEIPRLINGLWQLTGGHNKNVDIANAPAAMDAFIRNGLEVFDMADHYGDSGENALLAS